MAAPYSGMRLPLPMIRRAPYADLPNDLIAGMLQGQGQQPQPQAAYDGEGQAAMPEIAYSVPSGDQGMLQLPLLAQLGLGILSANQPRPAAHGPQSPIFSGLAAGLQAHMNQKQAAQTYAQQQAVAEYERQRKERSDLLDWKRYQLEVGKAQEQDPLEIVTREFADGSKQDGYWATGGNNNLPVWVGTGDVVEDASEDSGRGSRAERDRSYLTTHKDAVLAGTASQAVVDKMTQILYEMTQPKSRLNPDGTVTYYRGTIPPNLAQVAQKLGINTETEIVGDQQPTLTEMADIKDAEAKLAMLDRAIELAGPATVGPGGAVMRFAERAQDIAGKDPDMHAVEFQGIIRNIKATNWKEIVGSGQLAKHDKEFLNSVIKGEGFWEGTQEVKGSLKRLRSILAQSHGLPPTVFHHEGLDYDVVRSVWGEQRPDVRGGGKWPKGTYLVQRTHPETGETEQYFFEP